MPVRLSCPSCNTAFTLPQLPVDKRAECPRCGDHFPIRTFTEIVQSDGATVTTAAAPVASRFERQSRARLSVLRAVTIALLMGFAGLVVGFMVYFLQGGFRRPGGPLPEPPLPQLTAVAPGQLTSLGYLPADTNIAAVVQPGPVLEYARRMKQDPRELLIRAGLPEQVLDTLNALGLMLPVIDQVAVGTSVSDQAVKFRLTLVLALRRPLADEDAFRTGLKAHKHDGKGRYSIEFLGLPMLMARVSPVLWVFGLDEKDFEAVDRGGYGVGSPQLQGSLTRCIVEKLPPDAALWLATAEEQWSEKPGVKLLLGTVMGKKDWLPRLAQVRAVAASMSFEDSARIRLFVQAINESLAQQFRADFQKLVSTHDGLRTGGAGSWAFFDAPVDPINGLSDFQRELSAVGKP